MLGGTWMLSVGKGLARTWNWPVRESTRIVWLLLVKVRIYLARQGVKVVMLAGAVLLVVGADVELHHEAHHGGVDRPAGVPGGHVKGDDLVADRDDVTEVGGEEEAEHCELVAFQGEPRRRGGVVEIVWQGLLI